MSIARDGSGGAVFLADVSGTEHVFVSRLVGGVFQTPQQVDGGLGGASSQPVIAAGNGGVLLVAYINSGDLYETQVPGPSAPWSTPLMMQAGAEYPGLQLSNWGKAYLTFTAILGSNRYDVEAEYYASGTWQPVSAPLNVTPADGAGSTAGTRPAVATAGDGVGIAVWGENGHIYARRMWGTSPSVADERLDPSSFGGATEVTPATEPTVSVGGDSSYPDIVFHERLSSGSNIWNRVLMTRMIAEDVGGTVAVDGLSSTTPGDAGAPAIAMSEYGRGFILAGQSSAPYGLIGTPLANDGVPAAPPAQINQGTSTAPIAGVPAVAGTAAVLLAWEQASVPGQPQVLESYAPDGTTLSSPQVLSASGAEVQPQDGLTAAGDNYGDAAVAWIQGSSGSLSLQTAQLYQPPGPGQPTVRFAYTHTPTPRLQWRPGSDRWGPLSYVVTIGGAQQGQTSATWLTVPQALIDGPHRWRVATVNPAGQTATGRTSTVFVDTVAPVVSFRVSGRRRAHRQITLRVRALDRPAAQPGARASGLATIRILWGDGSVLREQGQLTQASHVYLHRGRFRIRVRVTDRAGNRGSSVQIVRIGK